MNRSPQIQLKTSAILNVPLQCYGEDFIFVVNGKEYKTQRLIADLLSKKISHLHSIDPTIYEYTINTDEKGDFSYILSLINFTKNNIPESEIPFLIEAVNILENDSIDIIQEEETTEITLNNVFDKIQKHECYSKYYSKSLHKEIEFISSHFSEIDERGKEKLSKLKLSTLIQIFESKNLKLKDEDQLFDIVNELYSKDSQYSILYETVDFLNVSTECICEFTSQFDVNDLTHQIWDKICERLKQTQNANKPKSDHRYINTIFNYSEDQPFSGIINHLMKQTNNNISNEISLTASSYFDQSEKYNIKNIALFDEPEKGFSTDGSSLGWLCIDFIKHKVIPSYYTIKSIGRYFSGEQFSLRSWVVEVSNDNGSWEIIDEVKNNSQLKGNLLVHTFKIQKPPTKAMRYFRIRSTDKDWGNYNYLCLNSLEIFGSLI